LAFTASIPIRIFETGDIFMAPDMQPIDFNATFLTLGSALADPFDNFPGDSEYAGSETLSAAIKRVNLDDDEDEEDEEEDDNFNEDDEEDDEDQYDDEDEDEEDDEDLDDEFDDDEDEDHDDEDEDDIKLI
jgi:hypothetical protein